jgi:hypothetical protein
MRLEIVTWRDAYFDQDVPDKQRKDYLVQTVGWTNRKGRFLRVRGERLPGKEGWRSITNIPIENVVERKEL